MNTGEKYMNNIVLPAVADNFPEIYTDACAMILGSAGLGIDDELSDFEAVFYLDGEMFKRRGAQLQLFLNALLARTNPWRAQGSILCVHPLTWALDGSAEKILSGGSVPWTDITIETLFTMQNDIIAHDPKSVLSKLKHLTSIQFYPRELIAQTLLEKLMHLILDGYNDLIKCVKRNNIAEAHMIFGGAVKTAYHIAFILQPDYYPWHTHLGWAFGKLAPAASRLGDIMHEMLFSTDWNKKAELLRDIIEFYKEHITRHEILPYINLYSHDIENELIWAQRLCAWKNPDWRDYITLREKTAVENGHTKEDFWVYSLWQ